MDNQNAKKPREYIAFISYRHKSLDTMLAARLHNMLKYYVIDKDLRDDPTRKRLGNVFRDRDELPLTDDLTEDIYDALDHSQFLIVICTNETPKSLWVSKEIEYFISKHGRERVLTVLAQDPPELSFPEEVTLIKDDAGNIIEQVEPLAAYVVGRNRLHILWKLRQEFPRLLAAILGKPYPQVAQQEKRYRQKRIMAALGAALVIAGGFIGMLLNRNAQINAQNQQITTQNQQITAQNEEIEAKNEEIRQQLETAQFNESQALALVSTQQLADGDHQAALKSALAALPIREDPRPYCAEAEFALANALYAYADERISFDLKITQSADILTYTLSQSGDRVVTLDAGGCLRCFDLSGGAELWKYQIDTPDGQAAKNLAENFRLLEIREKQNLVVLSTADNTWCLYLSTGNLKSFFTYNRADDVGLSQDGSVIVRHYSYIEYDDEDKTSGNYYEFYDSATGLEQGWCNYTGPGDWADAKCALSNDGSRAALFLISTELKVIEIFQVDTHTGNELSSQVLSLNLPTEDKTNTANPFPDLSATFGEFFFDDELMGLFLEDGSMLIYYIRRTEEAYTGRAFAYQYAPDGELQYSLTLEIPLTDEIPDPSVLGYRQDDTYHYFFHPTHITCLYKEELKRGYSLDLSDDYGVDVDSNPLVGFYVNDDYPVLFFQDGTVSARFSRPTYPSCDFSVASAQGVFSEGEVAAIHPETEANSLYFLRKTGDTRGLTLESYEAPDREGLYFYADGIYSLPAGNGFLAIERGSSEDIITYCITRYNANGAMAEQFEFQAPSFLDMCGFSRDGTKLLLDGYIYDMTTHTFTTQEDIEQAYDREFISVVTQTVPLASQGTENPVITAHCDYLENTLYWWEDGVNLQSTSPPEEMHFFYNATSDHDVLEIGGNGLILRRHTNSASTHGSHFAIFSTRTGQWRRVENEPLNDPAIAMGAELPVVAFADGDNVIRIYDFEVDAVIRELPVEADCRSCKNMLLLKNDTVLLMEYTGGRFIAIDATSGATLGQFTLDGFSEYNVASIQVDAEKNILYLADTRGHSTGLRIDMDQWQITAQIPRMVCWLESTDKIVTADTLNHHPPVLFDAYSLEDLIAWGQEILDDAS